MGTACGIPHPLTLVAQNVAGIPRTGVAVFDPFSA
jgi:hypothetical protein